MRTLVADATASFSTEHAAAGALLRL